MNEQLSAPREAIADLVTIDVRGRGHRQDGKFMSNHHLEVIDAYQDVIRGNEGVQGLINAELETVSTLNTAEDAVIPRVGKHFKKNEAPLVITADEFENTTRPFGKHYEKRETIETSEVEILRFLATEDETRPLRRAHGFRTEAADEAEVVDSEQVAQIFDFNEARRKPRISRLHKIGGVALAAVAGIASLAFLNRHNSNPFLISANAAETSTTTPNTSTSTSSSTTSTTEYATSSTTSSSTTSSTTLTTAAHEAITTPAEAQELSDAITKALPNIVLGNGTVTEITDLNATLPGPIEADQFSLDHGPQAWSGVPRTPNGNIEIGQRILNATDGFTQSDSEVARAALKHFGATDEIINELAQGNHSNIVIRFFTLNGDSAVYHQMSENINGHLQIEANRVVDPLDSDVIIVMSFKDADGNTVVEVGRGDCGWVQTFKTVTIETPAAPVVTAARPTTTTTRPPSTTTTTRPTTTTTKAPTTTTTTKAAPATTTTTITFTPPPSLGVPPTVVTSTSTTLPPGLPPKHGDGQPPREVSTTIPSSGTGDTLTPHDPTTTTDPTPTTEQTLPGEGTTTTAPQHGHQPA